MKKIKQGLSLMGHNRAPLLTSDFLFECVKMLRRNFCYQGPNFKQKCHWGRGQLHTLLQRPKGLDARKSVFESQQLNKLWHFIMKCEKYYYKMQQLFYYKMRQIYYKMRQVLIKAISPSNIKASSAENWELKNKQIPLQIIPVFQNSSFLLFWFCISRQKLCSSLSLQLHPFWISLLDPVFSYRSCRRYYLYNLSEC